MPYANMTIPGKVQSYMAVGKPIVGCINGACSNFIKNNEVGYACTSGGYKELTDLITRLDYTELKIIGKHSKEVYFKKYAKEMFINRLIDIFEECINE